MIPLEILKKFCDTSGIRPSMEQPWSRGDYTYATNGHIAIRVPRFPNVAENSGAPNAEKLFTEAFKRRGYQWVPSPQVEIPQVECDGCDGLGRYESEPEIPCEECEGAGKLEEIKGVIFEINDKRISLANIYIALINLLPNPEIGLIEAAAINDGFKGTPVRFRFDDGDGFLMPRRIFL